jgi:hypothetical protein
VTQAAVDLTLSLIIAGPRLPLHVLPAPINRRPRPSFSRLWHNAQRLTREQREEGRLWYPHESWRLTRLGQTYGIPAPVVIHAAAALTPGLRWERTMLVLGNMLDAYSVGARTWPRGGDATFGYRDREKAWEILRTGNLRLCSGQKVVPFAAALSGDLDAVVVDRHLVWLATGADVRQVGPAAMARIAAGVRVLAWSYGMAPRDVQAALWALRAG